MARALTEQSWFAVTAADRERFRKLRHSLPEMVNATVLQRGFMKMGTDYAVPLSRNREMLRYYRRRLETELPGHYVIYGHIGDAHVHVNMLPASAHEADVADCASEGIRRSRSPTRRYGISRAWLGKTQGLLAALQIRAIKSKP